MSALALATLPVQAADYAYVGTYTRNAPGGWSEQSDPQGLSVLKVAPDTGALELIATVPSDNPAFLALDADQSHLYVINEIADFEGGNAGSIEAYAIDGESGGLSLVNRVALPGPIPAHLALSPDGGHVVVGLYIGASYAVFSIEDDGSIGALTDNVAQTGSGPHSRQEAPHPHATTFDPGGNYLVTADLGTDKVQSYVLDDAGKLGLVAEASLPPGAGPRHVAFHPNGRYLYVINELTATITALDFDPQSGKFGAEIGTVATVPDDFPAHKSTAEIMVHPSGKYLYGSNRRFDDHPLADSIAAFSIDQDTGALTPIGHVTENIAFPRTFNFDPTGGWLYVLNQKGDSIVQLAIDQDTGELSSTGNITELPVPVSIVFTAGGG